MFSIEYYNLVDRKWIVRSTFSELFYALIAVLPDDRIVDCKGKVVYRPSVCKSC